MGIVKAADGAVNEAQVEHLLRDAYSVQHHGLPVAPQAGRPESRNTAQAASSSGSSRRRCGTSGSMTSS